MAQKKYWKGLEELNNNGAQQSKADDEFKELLPFADVSEDLLSATTPRRDFLKYLGFSTAAAVLAASCEMPVRQAIPYAIKPEDITPGVPNYYASTYVDGGDYCSVIIKTRDGRPIKIEGNELSSITRGGTSARVQGSVLSLYDKARLRQPYADGKPVDVFQDIDTKVKESLASGKAAYLLTGTIISPTVKSVIDQFIAKYPAAKHITYDAMSYSGMLLANEASYGKRALPSYHFDKAKTIVSIGADFLGTWLSPIEFAKGYSIGRKVSAAKPTMSRHYQFEAMHSLTGANADKRAVCKPSEFGAVAVALYNAVSTGATPSFASQVLNNYIAQAATDLKAGNGIVVCGSNDVAIQTVVNAINSAIGANGTTINWAVNSNYKQGIDSDIVTLATAMKAGQVGTLIMHEVNPVYDYMDGVGFAEGMKQVPVTVTTASHMDETAELCKFIVSDHHYLESWGDAEPKTGYFSLMQPGIAPLFKTRAFAGSLLKWADSTSSYADLWKAYWMGKLGSQAIFDKALQDGVIEPGTKMTVTDSTAATAAAAPATTSFSGATFSGNVGTAVAAIAAMKAPEGKELVIYEKVGIGRGGSNSNNPWLQEMPDPISKVTWDNYVCISQNLAEKLDGEGNQEMELTTQNEIKTSKRVLKVTVNGKDISLPAIVVPGMHPEVVAIAVGYGRSKKLGRAAADLGKNVFPMLTWNGTCFITNAPATVVKTDAHYDVAQTQSHMSYEGRDMIMREYTLEEFAKNPRELMEDRMEEFGHFAVLPWVEHEESNKGSGTAHNSKDPKEEYEAFMEGFRKNGTMFPDYEEPGIHWAMSIDLNTCIGCGACVVGCMAENNVSVVGKDKVLKNQEMHWINIDRYFTGDPLVADSIQTVFQVMLCQHCDNAPCENVCPVAATNHSSEGLNQMAYNRCIGTKYCANNCPYKVRRFNWMDWNGADCFEDNLYEDGRRDDINDDLTRMVLNPDVTVRSRGVMEKCSFCVQRLQDAKLEAKKEGHPMMDGRARTACQQACPTDAIVFGNVNDKTSSIYALRHSDQMERTYYALEDLHTLPNVNYLSKVRNTDMLVGGNEKTDIMMDKSI